MPLLCFLSDTVPPKLLSLPPPPALPTASTSVAFTTATTVTDIAPTLTSVSITGTAQEGQVLTAVGATPNETDDTVTYQDQKSTRPNSTHHITAHTYYSSQIHPRNHIRAR